ncbi:putative ATP-dependent RNA helicase DHR1 [Giardia muris]|uniref:Putative ATP-dependent RNA helicase DHR1 n=1 Tax=Giardia muris TaxID=5742 RepID=A0A4Z1TBU1_GIAMU|nr:putative ATP-dependent RNA helicase DHR1 [Giardia muris]|eukprot:TNJ29991.1 putative ATP-dependent RNA helicase DHR1 [Giardia muris]
MNVPKLKGREKRRAEALKRRENKDKRQACIAKMGELRMSVEEKALLTRTRSFGQRQTKREQLAEDQARARVGLDPIHRRLYQEREVDDTDFMPFNLETLPELVQSVPTDDMTTSLKIDGYEAENDSIEQKPCLEPPRHFLPKVHLDLEGNVFQASRHGTLAFPEVVIGSLLFTPQRSFPCFNRPEDLEAVRRTLPTQAFYHSFLDTLVQNDVILIKGVTGSGKSTQIPQYMIENGYAGPLTRPPTDEDVLERAQHARYGFEGRIYATEPRRIAAMGVASRVSAEMGASLGSVAGYIIKHDARVDKTEDDTRLIFMTEGVMLKLIESDNLLSEASCIIIDEAHERTLNLELLLGLLSRVVLERRRQFVAWFSKYHGLLEEIGELYNNFRTEDEEDHDKVTFQSVRRLAQKALRGEHVSCDNEFSNRVLAFMQHLRLRPPVTPLKLIIMSATLQVEDFLTSGIFQSTPAIIEIPSRAYPIAVHYSITTPVDYVKAAASKAAEVHRNYPPGTILVFLSGQSEIRRCMEILEKNLDDTSVVSHSERVATQSSHSLSTQEMDSSESEDIYHSNPARRLLQEFVANELTGNKYADIDGEVINKNGEDDVYNVVLNADDSPQTLDSIATLQKEFQMANQGPTETKLPHIILPLYGTMDLEDQRKIFSPEFKDDRVKRLIIVATNVAEASITVPNVRYVIDAGKAKQKQVANAISVLTAQFISKANADQRSGRAGRTAPGHCFRLYSPGLFQKMHDYPIPEIGRLPISHLLLSLLKLGISDVRSFPYLTRPREDRVSEALIELLVLGAISELRNGHLVSNLYKGQAKVAKGRRGYALEPLGNMISYLPLSPRMGRLLIASVLHSYAHLESTKRHEVLVYAALLGAVFEANITTESKVSWPVVWGHGDVMDKLVTVAAVLAFQSRAKQVKFCREHKLRLEEIDQLLATAIQCLRILKEKKMIGEDEDVTRSTVLMTIQGGMKPFVPPLLNWLLIQSLPDRLAFREDSATNTYAFQGILLKDLLEKENEITDLQEANISGPDRYGLTAEDVELFLEHRPSTQSARLSKYTTVTDDPTSVAYVSAYVFLQVKRPLDEDVQKSLRISVRLEQVIPFQRQELCTQSFFLSNPCFLLSQPKSVFFSAKADALQSTVDVYYIGSPAMPELSLGNVLVGEGVDEYPGRRFVDDSLKAGVKADMVLSLVRKHYCRMFLMHLINGNVFEELASVTAGAALNVGSLRTGVFITATTVQQFQPALKALEETGVTGRGSLRKYLRTRYTNVDDILTGLEYDLLWIGLQVCYRPAYRTRARGCWGELCKTIYI